jgi:sulfide:quinone oxidoreductase
MPAKNKKIVILGGGIGGIVTARDLRKHLGNQHRIILVDKNAFHTFQPSYFWMVIGWRTPAAITKPFTPLEKYGIEFHLGSVNAILPEQKKVVTDTGTLSFDYLVIAAGSENDFDTVPGLQAASNTFYTFEGAVELSKIIPRFPGGKIAIIVPNDGYKYPPAPYDTAFLLKSFYEKREMHDIDIQVFTPERMPLEFAGDEISSHIQDLLQQHHIECHTESVLKSIDSQKSILCLGDDRIIKFDLLITIPKYRPVSLPVESSLQNTEGWISVDKYTLQTHYDYIYAIGDATSIILDNGEPLPKAGVFANNQAEIVAYNIVQSINKNSERKQFSGYGFFFIETGTGRAANLHGNFFTQKEPRLSLNEPNVTFHWGKVVLEKYWIWRWF